MEKKCPFINFFIRLMGTVYYETPCIPVKFLYNLRYLWSFIYLQSLQLTLYKWWKNNKMESWWWRVCNFWTTEVCIHDFGSKGAAFFSGVKGDFEPPPKVTRFQNALTFVLVGAYWDEKSMLYPYWYSLRWKKIRSSLSVSGKFWLFLVC